MRDFFIAAAIAVPPVVGGVWLLLRGVARANAAASRALAARLDCPRCRERSLEWRGVVWGEDVLYDDREESFHGYVLRCTRCGREDRYTAGGELYVAGGPAGAAPERGE